jgi:hypothetical protein
MKFSLQGLMIGSLGAAALCLSPLSVSPAHAVMSGEITLGPERVQIVHAAGVGNDFTNFNITFTNFGDYPDFDCDAGQDDPIASGVEILLSQESCPSLCDTANSICVSNPVLLFPFAYDIEPFVSRIVNHSNYGTFFGLNGPGTVSAKIVRLFTPPPGEGCGTWNLNVEATGLDLSSITHNPMSIWIGDEDNSGPFEGLFCFNINNAIIGAPIPTPVPTPLPVHRRRRR